MSRFVWTLEELGHLIGVYDTEQEAWEAAQEECAVIHITRSHMELASGYTIEKVAK